MQAVQDPSQAPAITQLPPVVILMVTFDPGPWLEESLACVARQDYANYAVVIGDCSPSATAGARISAVLASTNLPNATVERLDPSLSFAGAINSLLRRLDHEGFVVLCHDDVRPDPDALKRMVEQSLRLNAAVVCPKYVAWDDQQRLLSVGMSVDKAGMPVPRVEPDEIDHGQHDEVRDVFLAPGGFLLVRFDVLSAIGGLDPTIASPVEDEDLSWRAKLAGARVVVAPSARVAHMRATTRGIRQQQRQQEASENQRERRSTQLLAQRRDQLKVALRCVQARHLPGLIGRWLLLDLVETVLAIAPSNRERAKATTLALFWAVRHIGEIRAARADTASRRVVSDKELRPRLLATTSALRSLLLPSGKQDHGEASSLATPSLKPPRSSSQEELLEGKGVDPAATFSDTSGIKDPEHLAPPSGSLAPLSGERLARPPERAAKLPGENQPERQWRWGILVWSIFGLFFAVGARLILFDPIPFLGHLGRVSGPSGSFAAFFDGYRAGPIKGPSSPATAWLGLIGILTFGWTALLRRLVLLGCIPLGIAGASRVMKPFRNKPASLATGLAYGLLPLPYDALARGAWGDLIIYAAIPWILVKLFQVASLQRSAWKTGLALAAILGVAFGFVPAIMFDAALGAFVIALGFAISAKWRSSIEVTKATAMGLLGGWILCLPWSLGFLEHGSSLGAWTGLGQPAWHAPSWGALLRLTNEPFGGVLSWGFIASAAISLVVAKKERFWFSARLWLIAMAAWVIAWLAGRSLLGSLQIPTGAVLPLAGVAIAGAIGVGVLSWQVDLPSHRFGWRQAASALGGLAILGCAVAFIGFSGSGRYGMPGEGYGTTAPRALPGKSWTLWVGNPQTVPVGAWEVSRGLAYGFSPSGERPSISSNWASPTAARTREAAKAIEAVEDGLTITAGKPLAGLGVSYVIVLTAIGPPVPGVQTGGISLPPPASLIQGFEAQEDMKVLSHVGGTLVMENEAYPSSSTTPQHLASLPAMPGSWASTGVRIGWMILFVALWAALGILLYKNQDTERQKRRPPGLDSAQHASGKGNPPGNPPTGRALSALGAWDKASGPSGWARLGVGVGVIALLVGIGGVDNNLTKPSPPRAITFISPTPEAAPSNAISSSWYCTGSTGGPKGPANATIELANASGHRISGEIEIAGEGLKSLAVTRLSLGPWQSRTVDPASLVKGAWLATSILMSKGEVVATQTLQGAWGEATAPCSSSSSTQWYFGPATTQVKHRLFLSLYDPLATTAVVNLHFLLPGGYTSAPANLQGLVVPAHGVLAEDIGKVLYKEPSLQTQVTAETGEVVAQELQVSLGAKQASLTTIAASGSAQLYWSIPGIELGPGLQVRLSILDPGNVPAKVEVQPELSHGTASAFHLVVPSNDNVTLDESTASRLPAGILYGLVIRSLNGVGIVVSQSSQATSSLPYRGVASQLASARLSRNWLFAVAPPGAQNTSLIILEPRKGSHPKETTLKLFELTPKGPIPLKGEPTKMTLMPQDPALVNLPAKLAEAGIPILVRASQPVAVSVGQWTPAHTGFSQWVTLPVPKFSLFPRKGD